MLQASLDELRARVLVHAKHEGYNPSPYPDIYMFRADKPVPPKRVQNPGVVVAVIADRRKVVQFHDGPTLSYTPGSYLFVTRETEYTSQVRAATTRRPYLSLGLALRPEQVAEAVLALDDAGDELGEDVDGWVAQLDETLLDAFIRMLRSIDDPVERRLVTPLIVREIIVRLLRSEHAGPLRRAARTDDGRIRRAIHFIREHAAGALTVEGIAKEVGMSPSHFAHRFREVARVSPMRYAKQARLQQARLLLLHEGMRVSEAALEVGYASPAQFTRDFKMTFGKSPTEYVLRFRDVSA